MTGEEYNEKLAKIEKKLSKIVELGEGKIIIHVKKGKITGVTIIEEERLNIEKEVK